MLLEILLAITYIIGVIICLIIFPKICPYEIEWTWVLGHWETKPKHEYYDKMILFAMTWPIAIIICTIVTFIKKIRF
jgi:hypothetical protein